MTADPLAYLHAAHAEARAEAEAASDGPEPESWHVAEQGTCECCDAIRTDKNVLVLTVDDRASAHIARHDPAAVLRRITAERKQLELHAPVPDHGRFSERGCPALCDGDHDEPSVCHTCRDYAGDPIDTPCPTIEILAEGWGWTPGQ